MSVIELKLRWSFVSGLALSWHKLSKGKETCQLYRTKLLCSPKYQLNLRHTFLKIFICLTVGVFLYLTITCTLFVYDVRLLYLSYFETKCQSNAPPRRKKVLSVTIIEHQNFVWFSTAYMIDLSLIEIIVIKIWYKKPKRHSAKSAKKFHCNNRENL